MTLSTGTATVKLLDQRQLWFFRYAYGVLVLLVVIIFVGHIPYMYQRALPVLDRDLQALASLQISPAVPALFDLLLRTVFVSGFTVISLLLFWKRAADPMAYLVSVMLLTTGYLYGTSAPRDQSLWLAGVIMTAIAETTQVLFFFTFPNGRYLPSWIRWLPAPLFIFRFLVWLNIYVTRTGQGAVEVGIVVLLILIGVGTQIHRYRKQSTATQRQQVKWLMISLGLTVLLVVPSIYLLSITGVISPSKNIFVYLLVRSIRDLALLSVPIMIGLAILRYRLWDIDLTLNRSLVGGAVTLILGTIFFVGFLGLQWLFSQTLSSSLSGLALGISGVGVGIAFNPVRKRVRHFVDRRLYHFRFDLNQLNRVVQRREKPEVKTPAALTGKLIAGYELLDLIGRGGMGEVYKGYKEGQIVAIKLLRDDVRETQPEIAERFHREAKVLAELRHPGIINMVEMDTRAHPPYLILEYIEGQNLSEYLKDHGAVAIDEFKRLAVEITKAIHYVHQQHIVHRDIKASNIMLKPNPEQGDKFDPVLMDFGIARGETTEITLTGSNAVGTIDYMAPEQIESAHDVDHHADTYALGVVFYEMLTGQRPFQGRPAQILFAHLQQPPPNPRELRPEIPDALARVVLRALRKKPEDRFPSLESMQEAILTSD